MERKEMRNLFVKFLKVKEKGWIKSLRKGTTGIGYTFETLIGKKEETLPIADYQGIEIKVKRRYSKGTITLFNAAPDNEIYATKRIYEKYSVQNKNFNYYKTFMINVSANEKKKYGKHLFKLSIDYKKKLIEMNIYDLAGNLIENNISWSFKLINEKIKMKIANLAIVKADIKEENNEIYYKYYHISYYEIKGINTFIKLIETGVISITFKISVDLSMKKFGEMKNHGIGFDINEKNIKKLYNLKDFEKKTTNSRF